MHSDICSIVTIRWPQTGAFQYSTLSLLATPRLFSTLGYSSHKYESWNTAQPTMSKPRMAYVDGIVVIVSDTTHIQMVAITLNVYKVCGSVGMALVT